MRHTDLKIGDQYIIRFGSHLRTVTLEWIDSIQVERGGRRLRRLRYYVRCDRTHVAMCVMSARRLRAPYNPLWG